MRVAVIGSGVSGLAAARVLARFGHDVVVYERDATVGGIWAHTYPQVRLQNIAEHYRLSDFPWPFAVDLHPTAGDVMRYLDAVATHFGLDVRLSHTVTAMTERPDGWTLEIDTPDGHETAEFDYVIIAVGLYSDRQASVDLPGRTEFAGTVMTEREVGDLDVFAGKRVTVVGFGKTAVDLATFAAERGAEVTHLFRAPRWLVPLHILGTHMSRQVTTRWGTVMVPSWVHPNVGVRALHWIRPLIWIYWKGVEWTFRLSHGLHPFHRDRAARQRLRELEPRQPLKYQMRAAAALAPPRYYPLVREGKVTPVRGSIESLSATAVKLADGREVPADIVVLAVGWDGPRFDFLPDRYRALMTAGEGGTQLYRHLVHPDIPRVGFAGYNHGFLHIPSVEVGTIWYAAVMAGDLKLPPKEVMRASTTRVARWKAANTLFEPTRAHGIGNRFHHYLGVLLRELGLRGWLKRNALDDVLKPYVAEDYRGVFDAYQQRRKTRTAPLESLPYDT